jgi:hypothetical protein
MHATAITLTTTEIIYAPWVAALVSRRSEGLGFPRQVHMKQVAHALAHPWSLRLSSGHGGEVVAASHGGPRSPGGMVRGRCKCNRQVCLRATGRSQQAERHSRQSVTAGGASQQAERQAERHSWRSVESLSTAAG